jgi:hypothetical protein
VMGHCEHLDYMKGGKCLSPSNCPILRKISYRGPNKGLWIHNINNKNSVPCVGERTIPTELSPLVSEVSANVLLIEGATSPA